MYLWQLIVNIPFEQVVAKSKALIYMLVALLVGACSAIEKKPDRFHHLTPIAIQTDMQEMADQLALITLTLLNSDSTDEVRRQKILPMLDRIETIAQSITAGGEVITNYSVINNYMGAFLYDVGIAQEFAQREPANLLPAGRLVRSCMSCHESI